MQRGRTCSEPTTSNSKNNSFINLLTNNSFISSSTTSNSFTTSLSSINLNNTSSNISSSSNLCSDDSTILFCEWIGCSKHFIGKQNFLKHIQSEHLLPPQSTIDGVNSSNNSPICYWHNCPRGGRPFGALYMLQQHLRAHTGEKPYQCLIKNCGKRYSRLENLKTHTRKHTGERPYRCNSCNSSFTNASDRSKHVERVHGGKKRYQCTECQCAYTDPSSLRKHILNAHGQLEWIAYKNRRQYERQNIYTNKLIN
ncbi:hypothetical protein Mgra_00004412 [Meloidogyne graminicola]|uniref:C2H2-type domain-containing protein n=1 Tax=Meloidogyne graminicola TaxID=189291 RepID=A0A8S9ZRT6_9BILA|nr:hypothetical protein Mgra_00004412 [Meloidogyne graminicola]